MLAAVRLLAGLLLLSPTPPAAAPLVQPSPASIAALPPEASAGRGAPLPFTEYEAENATVAGTTIGPDRTFGTLAAEASGRRAVRLERSGDSVTFVLAKPANALTLRYAIPDSSDGRGLDDRVGLYADGRKLADIPLTSRYSWFYGAYPFTNRPADLGAHHFYDHVRLLLPQTLAAGTRISLRLDGGGPAQWTIVDLIDFEQAPPPKAAPPEALSVLAFGADPSGRRSSAAAFETAIAKARRAGVPVWIPPGSYRIERHLIVDRVSLLGAGQWYSLLRGKGVGIYGKRAPHGSRDVVLKDFAIVGEVDERKDHAQLAAIGGAFSRSSISDLWLQHTKVGLWLDGPMDRLTISRLRIFDQTADGINFHRGVTHSIVEDSFVRNSGDDGLAMWSHRDADAGNIFRRNTIVAPILANGIAIYGGRDNIVADNLVADTVTEGGGLHFGSRFGATPAAGTTLFSGNMVVRGGVMDPHWRTGVGAFWIYALDHPIEGARIEARDMVLVDSSYEAIQFFGKPIAGVTLDRVEIRGAGTSALQLQAPGTAFIRDMVATGLGGPGIAGDTDAFRIVDGGGNRGWETEGPLSKP